MAKKKTRTTKALVPVVLPTTGLSRKAWAQQITNRYRQAQEDTLQHIVELGRMLIAAKAQIVHGEFQAMVRSDLPFVPRTAQMYMAVAEHWLVRKRDTSRFLPPTLGPTYDLTRLPDSVLKKGLADGRITPEMDRKDVARIKREHDRAQKDRAIRNWGQAIVVEQPTGEFHLGDCIKHIPKLRDKSVALLLTDPPYWREKTGARSSQSGDHMLDGKMVGDDKDAPERFGKMLDVLAPKLAKDAHAYVFCDAVSFPKFLPKFKKHFTFRNLLVWDKGRESGVGSTFYAPNYELIIFGTRGQSPRPLQDGRPPSILRYPALLPDDRDHPTPKPVDLLKFLIEQSTEKHELVVDPYAGSGSTGATCARTARHYFLVEKDKKFYDYARTWVAGVENMIEAA